MVKYIDEKLKKELKEKHKDKLKSLILPLDDNSENEIEVLAIIPDRSVMGQFQRFVGADPKKAQEILVKNCLVTNKEEVMSDDGLFYAAFGLISELMPIRQGKFGKV